MPRWACMSSSLPATVLVVLLSTFSRSPVAHAVGVPVYEPQKWNKAYKLSVTNITAKQQIGLDMLLSAGWGKNCHEEGYNTPATAAPLNSCYRKSNLNGTWSYWLKLPGDWRTNSNSYCYALDVYKGGFCKPGKGNKLRDPLFAQWITCDKLKQAVMADGARPVTKQQVLKGQPPSGHYIALKARNDSCTPYYCWLNDYTVLRKDSNSFWSWKEPRGPARDTDLFGRKVTNPENVILPGHYDIFCGYYHVVPQNMTIGVQIEDNPYLQNNLSEYVKFYQKSYPGIVVNLDVIPYNNATDDAFDLFSQTLIDQDLTWESKRNTSEWLDWQTKQQHQQQLQQPQPEPQLTDADFQPAPQATATGVPHPTGSSSVSSGWSIGGAGWGPPDPNAASSTSN